MVLQTKGYEKELSEVGKYICKYRKEAGYNQEVLADLANLSVNTIYRAECGKNGIALDTILAISDALHIPVEKFCPSRFENGTIDKEMKQLEYKYDQLTQSNKKVVLETIIPLINVLLLQQGA